MKKTSGNAAASHIFSKLAGYSAGSTEKVLKRLNTSGEGLDAFEAGLRREVYGPNQITAEQPTPWLIQLLKSFIDPFSGILLFLACVSFTMDIALAAPENRSWKTVIVICAMIALSGMLRFIQEFRSGRAAEKLKAMVHTTASVIRSDQGKYETEMTEIVPGDIISLAAGDMIPADARVISAKDLFVSQSSLTGESEPVEKYSSLRAPADPDRVPGLSDLDNILFMGTNVISGSAMAVVLSTGNETYFGAMAKTLVGQRAPTSFDKGLNSVSWVLIRFMLIMVPIVFMVNGFRKGDWLEALLFAISIAVGLTPEMLPMIVTTNLAKGAVVMARHKTVVKRLNAIQNFGAMDILCTDKTGTLTLDRIVLERHLDIHGNEDERVVRHAYLNSYFQTGLKNLMDVAVLDFGSKIGFANLEKVYRKVDEIPFDFTRRRMSVVLEDAGGKRQLVTKGAMEEMLAVCTFAEYNGQIFPLTQDIRDEVNAMVKRLNEDGMRVLAVAQKNNMPSEGAFGVKDEADLVLMGYIGFLDPPKESAALAIKALNEYGVRVKVLTGDNEAITKTICGKVGLPADRILLGSQTDGMTDGELAREAESITVFAKLSPLQKTRIVKALKSSGHTVGYMGDGINDAPALREADVGISVDTAVDIAKESADIILLEKNLMVLKNGVMEGRRTFGNIIKYIKMTASSNFGNMFSVVAASVFLPFLPMMPVQILLLNLIYDFSCISIPWDNMDADYLKVPRKWDASSLGKFMIWMGPTSSVFDIATYLVMFFIICPAALGGAYGAAGVNGVLFRSLFNAGWFVESLWSQTLVIHMIRTPKIPFIQSRASLPVLLVTTAGIITGTLIPYTPFGAIIGMLPMPLTYFPWLIGMIFLYMGLATLLKTLYARKYGQLL
jgi:P-type Mg2+ transporter